MSIAHPPSVFVSSTCYDLAQVRQDLRLFFESLGMVPILSEFPSFPVDPNLDAIENCLVGVKEKADIFVLVVGGRYGSETNNGKSVTNLEYLEAKAKGIPLYVFVQKHIQTAYSDWQKNRSGDFSKIVDSSKLFEFVELLYDPMEKNWVFPFESAQDITKTLHVQLAYLFMDALTIRAKMRRSGLSEALMQDLSGAALLLTVQKPFAWEYRLFCRVMNDEISHVASIKKDFNYGLALGKAVRLSDLSEVVKWVQMKLGELMSFSESANVLFNKALPKAFGAPGEPADVEEIVYVGKRLAEIYRRALEWTAEFRQIQVEDEFSRLLEITSRAPNNLIEEIETFPVNLNQQFDAAERRYKETKQPQSLKSTLTLKCPDMTELDGELRRLRKLGFK